jgi:uncharacterized protein DUF3300
MERIRFDRGAIMKIGLVRMMASALGLMLVVPMPGYAQAVSIQLAQYTQVQDQAPDSQAVAPAYVPQQLDQMLAPIALYPDPLLSQILMASTYPLEVVEAARWAQDPNNGRLRGAELDAALAQQNWDPSVKSLVPFPQVLQMMNNRLDWMQALGNAFLAQQGDVMDSVQRLRAEAQAAGTLQSTPQEVVQNDGPAIVIEPARPDVVYVPYYDPTVVYGAWEYPDYPPFYFPPPPGYVVGPGIYFGVGFGIVGALWGWDDWDWGHRRVHVDYDRWREIDHGHDRDAGRFTGDTWQHDPYHRRGVPYRDPVVRQRFQQASAGSPDARRDFRGYDNRANRNGPGNQAPSGQAPNNRQNFGQQNLGQSNRPGGDNRSSLNQPNAGQPNGGGQKFNQPDLGGPSGATHADSTRGNREAFQQGGQVPPSNGRQLPTLPSGQQHQTQAQVLQQQPPGGPHPLATARVVTPPPVPHATPPSQQVTTFRGTPPQPNVQRPIAPAFSGFGKGPDIRAQSQRGQVSRQSIPAAVPHNVPVAVPHNAPAPSHPAAPANNGGHGGGGGGGHQGGGGNGQKQQQQH